LAQCFATPSLIFFHSLSQLKNHGTNVNAILWLIRPALANDFDERRFGKAMLSPTWINKGRLFILDSFLQSSGAALVIEWIHARHHGIKHVSQAPNVNASVKGQVKVFLKRAKKETMHEQQQQKQLLRIELSEGFTVHGSLVHVSAPYYVPRERAKVRALGCFCNDNTLDSPRRNK
jgi:hypothetical protein